MAFCRNSFCSNTVVMLFEYCHGAFCVYSASLSLYCQVSDDAQNSSVLKETSSLFKKDKSTLEKAVSTVH